MRSFIGKLRPPAALLGGLAFATVAGESYLRLVEATPALWKVLPAAEATFYGPDLHTSYAIRPGAAGVWLRENRTYVRMSTQGLRDHETSYQKPPDTFRIALAGDSIAEALQVDLDETFAILLERRRTADGRRVEVVNLGMSGAMPTVQVARMEHLGTRFDPDLLVYLINVSDFASPLLGDDREVPGYVAGGDGAYRLGHRFRDSDLYHFRAGPKGRVYYWLLDHTRVARVLNARRNVGWSNAATTAPATGPGSTCDPSKTQALAETLRGSLEDRRPKAILSAFLRDVARTSSTAGAPAALALRGLVPRCPAEADARQVLAAEMARELDAHGIGLVDLDRHLELALRENGSKHDSRELYGFGASRGEGHLNTFGHRVFATALDRGLAPWLGGIPAGSRADGSSPRW